VNFGRSSLRRSRLRRRAFADAPLNEQRNFFGLGDPGERVVPKVNVDEYNDAYGASPTS
jgi:hypothetical protein